MINLENISFTYGQSPCLKNVSLKVKKGESIAIIGPSGNGKTSIIRTINGLIPNYFENGSLQGKVYIDGKKADEFPMWKRGKKVGSVFQDPRTQFFSNKVEGEIAFACENYGLNHDRIMTCTKDIIKQLRLQELEDKNLSELSSGERQKVAIASAMVTKPEVLIFDEPSANLDTEGVDNLKHTLEILKNNGATMVFAEHRIYYLLDIVDRFLYIEDGKIVKEYSKEEIKKISLLQQQKLGIRCPFKTRIKSLKKISKRQDDPVIELDNISLTIKGKNIIKNCSFTGCSGEIIAVLGTNGAGKTTLAKVLCGMYKESQGDILINGKRTNRKKRNKKVWYSANETQTQFFTNSIEKEILIGIDRTTEKLEKARELLKLFNLYDIRDKHPYALSGGQKQRLSILCGLLSDRDILILDEPSSGLDYRNMEILAKTIKNAASMNKTILLITHDYELVNACCTHYYNLSEGNVYES
ncbi:ABC transporter ATP-binding protein [Vallitalea guaymasensis]|uniref:ABC transporter ATP-binding protein n=1 Tax=Vallitalea guaymasensis TaxID=1185412 RepID=A0A8J8M847_9FIRM|nr:ABC transporter ATP-binding protein [Vallitalea guaymasensis]QUH28066.1 ABC transporter ATP-binding protein [Vallitalea guaymasensis]